jgi:hypothetical protein
VSLALTLPFVDVDQRNSPQPGNRRLTIRARIVVAFLTLFALWMAVRWLVL